MREKERLTIVCEYTYFGIWGGRNGDGLELTP